MIGLTLDASGGVAKATVLAQNTESIREPTHGLIAGDELLFIANSGWDGFDDKGAVKNEHNLVPPVVLSLKVRF